MLNKQQMKYLSISCKLVLVAAGGMIRAFTSVASRRIFFPHRFAYTVDQSHIRILYSYWREKIERERNTANGESRKQKNSDEASSFEDDETVEEQYKVNIEGIRNGLKKKFQKKIRSFSETLKQAIKNHMIVLKHLRPQGSQQVKSEFECIFFFNYVLWCAL